MPESFFRFFPFAPATNINLLKKNNQQLEAHLLTEKW